MPDTVGVRIRPVLDSDLDTLFEQQNDEGAQWMAAFISGRPPHDRDAFDRHWQRIRNDSDITIMTVLTGDEIAGYVLSFAFAGEREAGYWIGRAYWGRGIATEAMAQFLQVELTRPLSARVAAGNAGSIRVLEKNGFVRVGEETSFAPARQTEIREYVFRLT